MDREKASQSFFGALSLTTKKMRIYPIEGNQNTEQTILMMDRLQRETDEGKKIAVVLDNARFHHARARTVRNGNDNMNDVNRAATSSWG